MESADRRADRRGATLPESLIVSAGLLAVLAAQLTLGDGWFLFGRHFWVDEIFTHTLCSDPDFGHAMRALAGGVETHPPGLYLWLRAFTSLFGQSEAAYRGFSLLCVLLALVGVYVSLRRAFPPLASGLALLAMGCQPLLLKQAFEARFYAPWLAGTVWFAYFLARYRDGSGGWGRAAAVAVSAIFVCTIHYFGIITVALVTGFELLLHRPREGPRWKGLPLVIPGLLALAACIPLLLSQRAALTVSSWASAATEARIKFFLTQVFYPWPVCIVLAGVWLDALRRAARKEARQPSGPADFSFTTGDALNQARREARQASGPAEPIRGLAGLTGVTLLPLVLILLSWTVQPMTVARYALPAVVGLVPAVALILSSLPRPLTLALGVLFAVAGGWNLNDQAVEARATDWETGQLVAALRTSTGEAAVTFERQHALYVVCRYAPDLAGRCYFLDFEAGQVASSRERLFSRDLARQYTAFYGAPALVRWEDFRDRPPRYLVPDFGNRGITPLPAGTYPGFTSVSVGAGVFRLDPLPPDSPAGDAAVP